MSDVIDQVTTPSDPIAAAVGYYAHKLSPGSAEQLTRLWQGQFDGLSAEVIRDIVGQRLAADASYSKFLADGVLPVPAPPARPTTTEQLREAASARRTNPLAGGKTALG